MTAITIQPAWMGSAKWRPRMRSAFLLALVGHLLAWIALGPLLRDETAIAPKSSLEITLVPTPLPQHFTQAALDPIIVSAPKMIGGPPPVEVEPVATPVPIGPVISRVESVGKLQSEIVDLIDGGEIRSHLQRYNLDSTPNVDLLTKPDAVAPSYSLPMRRNLLAELDRPIPDMVSEETPLHGLRFYPIGITGKIARAADAVKDAMTFTYKTRYGTEVKCVFAGTQGIIMYICGF